MVTKAMRYAANLYCPKEPPCQVSILYNLSQSSYGALSFEPCTVMLQVVF